MPNWKSALLGVALVAMPVAAHAETPTPVVQPTAERLAAAQQLMTVLMPAEQRDAMVEQMITAMMANLIPGLRDGIDVNGLLEQPDVKQVFDRFLARQQQSAIEDLKAEMPNMIEAMSRAYARRFTTAQMGEMRLFFQTPTGQLYMRESMTIMSDPDVAAWQRNSVSQSMKRLPEQLQRMRQELDEIRDRPAKGGKA